MKPGEFRKLERKVGGSESVKVVKIEYIDNEYNLELYPKKKTTETGFLEFGRLIPPQSSNLPTFVFRWDHSLKNTQKETVDVEIYVNGKSAKKLWNESGYDGHWPSKEREVDGKRLNRGYEINIKIPGRQIFKGIIDIGLAFEVYKRN